MGGVTGVSPAQCGEQRGERQEDGGWRVASIYLSTTNTRTSTPSCLLSPPPHHHCQQNCETRNNWLLPTLWYSLVRVSLQSGMDFMIFVVAETCTLQSKFVSSNTSAVEIPSKKTVNRLFQNITKNLNQRTAFLKMFWFMFWRPII